MFKKLTLINISILGFLGLLESNKVHAACPDYLSESRRIKARYNNMHQKDYDEQQREYYKAQSESRNREWDMALATPLTPPSDILLYPNNKQRGKVIEVPVLGIDAFHEEFKRAESLYLSSSTISYSAVIDAVHKNNVSDLAPNQIGLKTLDKISRDDSNPYKIYASRYMDDIRIKSNK